MPQAPSLYERLGGVYPIATVIDDFVDRVMANPILNANPNVHLKIGGYADSADSTAENLQLSQERANNVVGELVRLGVAPDRLAAEGYGEEHRVADRPTDAGRAMNRRISMLVTQE